MMDGLAAEAAVPNKVMTNATCLKAHCTATSLWSKKGIKPYIPGRKSRGKPITHDKRRCKRRNRIEIMFARLKDWRRVATRYDRCPKVFFRPSPSPQPSCSGNDPRTSPDPSKIVVFFGSKEGVGKGSSFSRSASAR